MAYIHKHNYISILKLLVW